MSRACYRLKKSAESGFARAQHALGLLHERGAGVPRSLVDATAWFRKAAEQGYRDAQVSLATQYFLGRGAPRDYAEAARWYERAAEQGDEGAAYIVASQYETGNGVETDTMRAFYWYSIAAASGDAVAALKAQPKNWASTSSPISPRAIYWMLLALTSLVFLTGWLINRSRLGIRDADHRQ